MGVTGLWTVVHPAARPIKLETLNKKRLAVDASIWIYQFLKAVRDKEGNALRNSHIVGFFRRICKLLFIGIKPVFVFDGGAPALKRQTISGRKARREGRREDAVRTAGKLLAMQLQRRAEEEEEERKRKKQRESGQVATRALQEEEEVPDDAVYVDELQMTQQERQQNRKFKKKDQYHLPNLDTPLAEMGQPNDPRVMSLEELQAYADQFNTGEDVNVYDFSKIDFDSQFFVSLPASDRYNILNAARLRSRLRMGLSKEQLDTMFPNRMDFSRFQVERVRERNELTQRLMSINNNDEPWSIDGGGRIAGEKGREYVLVKNDGVEGGWALGVISDSTEGQRNKPIDVDEITGKARLEEANDEEEDEDDAFEDVPVEGLNRLPRLPQRAQPSMTEQAVRNTFKKRTAEYQARRPVKAGAPVPPAPPPRLATEDSDSLFIDQEPADQDNGAIETDDEELQRAIAMSLEVDDETTSAPAITSTSSPDDDDFEEVFGGPERSSLASKPSVTNTPRKAVPFVDDDSDDEQYAVDMDKALSESRGSMYKSKTSPQKPPPDLARTTVSKTAPKPAFSGPLPFEKLDLGSSLLGKKKMQQREEEAAGGFERNEGKHTSKKETAEPLPPWFNADIKAGLDEQNVMEGKDRLKEREEEENASFEFVSKPARLRQHDTNEVIDVDALEDERKEVIDIDESDDDGDVFSRRSTQPKRTLIVDDELLMGDVADKIRADPPEPTAAIPAQQRQAQTEPINQSSLEKAVAESAVPAPAQDEAKAGTLPFDNQSSDEEPLEWDESDHEQAVAQAAEATKPAGGPLKTPKSPSPDFEFEDVDMQAPVTNGVSKPKSPSPLFVDSDEDNIIHPTTGTGDDLLPAEDDDAASDADRDYYSELSDIELLDQLATETEEHARFASQLAHIQSSTNNHQSTEEFERELKALRSQQRADRRDADEVTQTMVLECQQLLSHFGLPYITAPMEAEAQCAELVRLRLVDGIVTDDSDIFLFGGTRVYKNMFNAAKYVECYLASDLEREFDLSRNKMIAIAHLLGSDYTEGLPGVGPVTALEILSEFPNGASGGLVEFKEWWTRVQTGAPPSELDKTSDFRRKFRKKSAKLFLPPVFPDLRVDVAYLEPEVDSDPSAFVWGVPDLDSLRSFLMATIGWTQERTDEVLVPVIRDMNRREKEGTQSNITQFIGGTIGVGARAQIGSSGMAGGGDHEAFAPRRKDAGKSRRMEVALERLAEKARERRRAGIADKHNDDVAIDFTAGDDDTAVPGVATASMAAVDETKATKASKKKGTTTKTKSKANGRKRKAARNVDDDDEADEGVANGDNYAIDDDDDTPQPKPKKKRPARKTKKQVVDETSD